MPKDRTRCTCLDFIPGTLALKLNPLTMRPLCLLRGFIFMFRDRAIKGVVSLLDHFVLSLRNTPFQQGISLPRDRRWPFAITLLHKHDKIREVNWVNSHPIIGIGNTRDKDPPGIDKEALQYSLRSMHKKRKVVQNKILFNTES